MIKKNIQEASFGKTLGTAAAVGAGLYGAKKLGQALKDPNTLRAAGGIAKAAGQVGSTLLQLVAPIVKEVGPAVAKSIIKQRYGIDIPDVTLNAVKKTSDSTASTPSATPPVLTSVEPTASSTTGAETSSAAPVTKIVPKGTAAKVNKEALKSEINKLNDKLKYQAPGSTAYTNVQKELDERLKELESLPESLQIEFLNEFVPALVGAARIAGPVIGRALTSNTAKQIGKQVAVNAGFTGANKIINKLEKKNDVSNINNNEMEELIKSKEKKIKLSNEGIGTGTLGAIAGGLMGGVPGAAIGGLAAGAAPKAVKEIKGAFEGEESKNKKKKKKVNESTDFVKFVYNISQKNYAEANKYLKDIIDSKIKGRIESCLDNKIF